ncbi:MAG: AbrB/MazE/SpoVT family DNA-binding domain-containing protein [Kiritimatiellae bacterium]|nr:AbrB/MazE/SpoVT family DNA-binding domain-containing protein [Kiritimatiellia bacterium]
MTTATLCERGQITIPKKFRTQLGYRPGMVFDFRVVGKDLRMTPARPEQPKKRNPFEEARGILKGVFGNMSSDEIVREMRGC